MWRMVFNGLCALSLILCVAIVVLWARSYAGESIAWHSPYTAEPPKVWRMTEVGSERGCVTFFWYRETWPALLPSERARWFATQSLLEATGPSGWRYARGRGLLPEMPAGSSGFCFLRETGGIDTKYSDERRYETRSDELIITLPYWFIAALTLALPLFWALAKLRRRRHRMRIARSLCSSCSYDLTGNASGVCPECGIPVAKNQEANA